MLENDFKTTNLKKMKETSKPKKKIFPLVLSVTIVLVTFLVAFGITIGFYLAKNGAV